MKALILAAGYEKRLRPITNEIPKCMVEVGGVPLLINALNNLIEIGISEVGIVVGHKADYIKEKIGNSYKNTRISYFKNEKFLETNNIYSLYMASEFCDDEMLLLEADLFYKEFDIKIVNVLESSWHEIDDIADLERARKSASL